MNDGKRILALALIMAVVAVVIAGTALGGLYGAAFEQARLRLVAMAQTQARMMESMARFDAEYSTSFHGGPAEATLAQLRYVHERSEGFGTTGEFTVARREGDQIVFVLGHRHGNRDDPPSIPFASPLAEPMRRALSGRSGTVVGPDYRGTMVLAAHEYIPDLALGIVAKIDLAEVRAPFITAGAWVLAIGAAAVAVGVVLFAAIGGQMVRHVRDSERRFHELFENMSSGVAVYEAVDGGEDFVFKDFNRAGERIERLSRTEIVGRRVTEVFPGVAEFGLLDVFRRVYQTGLSEHFPVTQYKDERITGWRENVVYRLSGGEVVAIYDDVTRLKEAEHNLIQAQKMEAVGQLTGGIAHDFNNILAVIMGNLEFLEEQLEEGSALQRLVRRARDAGQRGADLTGRLLAFSRKQFLKPAVLNAGEVISAMVELLRRTLDAPVTIQTVLPGNLMPVLADRAHLEAAIVNLAVNAHAAMPEGGIFRVEMQNVTIEEEPTPKRRDLVVGRYVAIAVSDTGTGMSAEVRDHAFEPFFTTKEAGRGSGLGLSMVYGFAKQSGGTAVIESLLGRGTTVTLFLPVADCPPEPLEAINSGNRDLPGGHETILIAEDDAEVRAVAAKRLAGLGYRVLEAETGDRALTLLDEGPAVDLLFTDVVMPGTLSGMDLARLAAEKIPGIKVLFTSGYPSSRLGSGRVAEGEVRLLGKPYTRKELAAAVREVLDERCRTIVTD